MLAEACASHLGYPFTSAIAVNLIGALIHGLMQAQICHHSPASKSHRVFRDFQAIMTAAFTSFPALLTASQDTIHSLVLIDSIDAAATLLLALALVLSILLAAVGLHTLGRYYSNRVDLSPAWLTACYDVCFGTAIIIVLLTGFTDPDDLKQHIMTFGVGSIASYAAFVTMDGVEQLLCVGTSVRASSLISNLLACMALAVLMALWHPKTMGPDSLDRSLVLRSIGSYSGTLSAFADTSQAGHAAWQAQQFWPWLHCYAVVSLIGLLVVPS